MFLPDINNEIEEVIIGEERLSFNAFFKKYNYFRVADFISKIKTFDDKVQLPFGSCVHFLDTLYNLERNILPNDLPNLNLPFIKNETEKKIMYHVKKPDINNSINPIKIEDKYLYISRGQNKVLNKDKIDNASKYLTVEKIEQLSSFSPTRLLMVNHNLTNRIKVRGILSTHRKLKLMLASFINTASKIKNRQNYLLIPVGDKIYQRDKFNMTKTKLDITSIKDRDSYHYLLMMHYLNFIDENTTNSIFNDIPEDLYKSLNFIFYVGNNYIMFNLHDVKSVNKKNRFYVKLINQFNTLVLSGLGLTIKNIDDKDDSNIEEDIELISKSISSTDKNDLDTSIVNIEDKIEDSDSANIPVLPDGNIEEDVVLLSELDRVEEDSNNKLLDDDILSSNINQLKQVSSKNITTLVPELLSNVEEDTEETIIEDDGINLKAPINTFGELSNITISKTGEDNKNISQAFIDDIDSISEELINSNMNLTPKEKARLFYLSTAYKDIELDGEPIIDVLVNDSDPSIQKEKIEGLDDYLVDKSMSTSSTMDFDSSYMNNTYLKDLLSVAVSFNKQGMFLTGVKQNLELTSTDKLVTYTFSYTSIDNKKHNVTFTVPYINRDGTCQIGGNKSYFRKQIVILPICKVSEVRVSLASYYNKAIVERSTTKAHSFVHYFKRLVSRVEDSFPVFYEYQNIILNEKIAYEYSELSKVYKFLNFKTNKGNLYLTFNKENRLSTFSKIKYDTPLDKLENKYGIFIGEYKGTSDHVLLFINISNIISLVNVKTKEVTYSNFISLITSIYNFRLSSQLTEWTDIKLLDKKLPIGVLICYQYGLRNTLDYLGVKYTKVNKSIKQGTESYEIGYEDIKPTKYKIKADDIVLKFRDANYYIPRYPLRNSLIIAGLCNYDLSKYMSEDFDTKDIYYKLFSDNKLSVNYLKGIEDTFSMFIDPITFDILKQMNEPTNFRDLLIRATDMLTTTKHNPASSMTNHRIRTFEKINTILYNEITRQFSSYKRKGGQVPFSLNPKSVLLKILQDPAMSAIDEINPVHDIKTTATITFTGTGGRDSGAFTEGDRLLTTDALGVISEATPDSGIAGVTGQLPMNSNIVNNRGMIDNNIDKDNLNPTDVLSPTTLLMPGTTQDDGKRANYTSIQLSHQVGTESGESLRIRTGYERVIPHMCRDIYAISAKQDGVVLLVDDKLKIFKIQYEDGTILTYSFDTQYGISSDIVTRQTRKLLIKEGDTFKKDEILSYNPDFFEEVIGERQVDWKHGNIANVALLETANTYEDSNIITQSFGEKLSIKPIHVRTVTLTNNTMIHQVVNKGDHVGIADSLVIFEDGDIIDMTNIAKTDLALDYISKLNRKTPKAKSHGEIVKIEMLIGCDPSELHPSLLKLYTELNKSEKALWNLSKDSDNAIENLPKIPIEKGEKVNGVFFDETVVVLKFFIQEHVRAAVGDKVVIDSSLKSVCAETIDYTPTTESGVPIDLIYSASGVSNRIVNSPVIVGISERILEKLEEDIVSMYFNE